MISGAVAGIAWLVSGDEEVFPPRAFVVGMPPQSVERNIPPYQGKHPSRIKRPRETFQFPIRLGESGPVKPLFAGPLQYPFLCGVRASGLGQPLADNYKGWGVPVYAMGSDGRLQDRVVGYSKDCQLPTQASYYYNRVGTTSFFPLSEARGDIARIIVNGRETDFVVRMETGTINRYLYTIAALRGEGEQLGLPDSSNWNRKLIYQFRGGVGIGFRQGHDGTNTIFKRRYEQLAQGYAVVYSSGTKTSNHYNMWLSEDTALRVKRQFVALYGKPFYTVGVGGSGGAIQQYLLAQNHPGIIDAVIAEYSYPDMLTQTLYGLECELLEYYFDVLDRDNPRWKDWENRQLVEGTNAHNGHEYEYVWARYLSELRAGLWPSASNGSSECVQGWRGLSPLVHNPRYAHFQKYFRSDVVDQVHWTYWSNLKYLYGTDARGYGNSTWDNVGVQYGLIALRKGKITVHEFLKLNASIGGWKAFENMQRERYWFVDDDDYFPVRVSVWSHHNMVVGNLKNPAPRNQGNLAAMEAAWRSGHIFSGQLDIPIIDLRHYLEPELNMHHAMASFSVRQRLLREQGHADNQLIWINRKPHDFEPEAFAVIDNWMQKIRANPGLSVVENKAKGAVDKCVDKKGNVIAAGPDVWNGSWNRKPEGLCSAAYPVFSDSRQQAGADIAGDVLKCHLQPVRKAMTRGVYGAVNMKPWLKQLEAIFPDGVCDYRLGDVSRPTDLLDD